jgi:hypothetical protein
MLFQSVVFSTLYLGDSIALSPCTANAHRPSNAQTFGSQLMKMINVIIIPQCDSGRFEVTR